MPAPPSIDPPTLDPRALAAIAALPSTGSGDFVPRLLDLYRAQAAERLSVLRSASAAGDWATVQRVAHAWKASAGQIGAARLAGLLVRLNDQCRDGVPVDGLSLVQDVDVEHARVLGALEAR